MSRIVAGLCWAMLAAGPALAALGGGSGVQVDQIVRRVFPPNLVIANQRQIGLTDAQREQFVAEMQRTQAELLPLQMEVSQAGEELARMLELPRVDEVEALRLTRAILELEARIKERHMTLLVRTKNLLTEEQQRQLRQIRRRRGRP